ncbi:alanine racemase [Schaalia sp. lx-100]|nr:alanine racemase [Schaalia sp. lx-260]MCD4556835.1 alanine racemase [Schaalia sp. lx-100]
MRHNVRALQRLAPQSQFMAIVKGNAYGHGLIPVAVAALEAGASWFGVAQVSEALELRRGLDELGISRDKARILTWIAPPATDWVPLITSDIDLAVSWTWVLEEIVEAAIRCATPARIHVKIDTGMSRAGSTIEDLLLLAQSVHESLHKGHVELIGAWTHLSRADDMSEAGRASTAEHMKIFAEGLSILEKEGLHPQIRHAAATAGILWHPETHLDMVRAGIGIYGLSPDPDVASSHELGLHPAMRISAPLTSVKKVAYDRPISYGGTARTQTDRWLGLVPIGYADGVLRASSPGAYVIVRTDRGPVRAPVVGRICMDQFIIDLGPVTADTLPPAQVGNTAIVIGDATRGEPSADEWAQAASTINYEVVTRVGERLRRHWTDSEQTCENAQYDLV